jgi:hypothetical protein
VVCDSVRFGRGYEVTDYSAIIEAAGGRYLGTEEGYIWLNAPSNSTLVILESEFSYERVLERLEEDANKDWPKGKVA